MRAVEAGGEDALVAVNAARPCSSGVHELRWTLLENYYFPGDLEASIDRFVDHYNHRRYHESLSNLTPADVYFGRGQTILLERERIKRNTERKPPKLK